MKANISEIFYSAQGEGEYIGVAQVFIRFASCPFDCPYCDTDTLEKEFFQIGDNIYKNPVTVDELLEILIKEFGKGDNFHSYSITGGEPLVNFEFISALALNLKKVSKAKLFLETSGLITKYFKDLDNLFDIISIDIKTHSEKVLKNLPILLDSLKDIKHSDYYLKLLLPNDNSKNIIDYTSNILSQYNIKNIIIQPVDNFITESTLNYLYNQFYRKNIEARVVSQSHKLLALP